MLHVFRHARKAVAVVLISAALLTCFSTSTFAASFRPQIKVTKSSAEVPESTEKNTGEITWIGGRVQKTGECDDAIVQIGYDLSLFSSLTVNGKELVLNEEYYLEEGSTIITLTSAYLSGLESGNYTLAAHYSDGKDFLTVFAVTEDPASVDASLLTPDTGSMAIQNFGANLGKNIPFVLFALLLMAALVWFVKRTLVSRRKYSSRRMRNFASSKKSNFRLFMDVKHDSMRKIIERIRLSHSFSLKRSYNPVLKKHVFVSIIACAIVVSGGVFVFANVFMSASEEKEVLAVGDGQDTLSISATNENFIKELDLSSGNAFTFTSQTLTVNEATEHGYQLFISTDSSEYNDLSINGSISADTRISSSSGTASAPVVLEGNTYGWATKNSTFGSNYTPSVNSKWAGVPVSGSGALVKNVTEATSAGDTTQIYYGFNVNDDLPDGTYYGTNNSTIVYTLVANVFGGL